MCEPALHHCPGFSLCASQRMVRSIASWLIWFYTDVIRDCSIERWKQSPLQKTTICYILLQSINGFGFTGLTISILFCNINLRTWFFHEWRLKDYYMIQSFIKVRVILFLLRIKELEFLQNLIDKMSLSKCPHLILVIEIIPDYVRVWEAYSYDQNTCRTIPVYCKQEKKIAIQVNCPLNCFGIESPNLKTFPKVICTTIP